MAETGIHHLHGQKGWGSALVELALARCALPYDVHDVDMDAGGREQLRPLNPLGQIPILVLPDGTVMTESAAIILYPDAVAPGAGLVPPAGTAEHARFLRWLLYLVAAIYSTFTYGDYPARWVGEDAAPRLKDSVTDQLKRNWQALETQAGAPWFLGERFSALDIYLAVLTNWRPGPAWFATHCPRLTAIAAKARTLPDLEAAYRRNYQPT